MMNAQCPECHTRARITADQIDVVVCEHGAQCGWTCIGCQHRQTCLVDARALAELASCGVHIFIIPPETGGRGDPIDESDILRFLADLHRADGA